MNYRHVPLMLTAIVAAACASSEPKKTSDPIGDFIRVSQLESVNTVRTEGNYSFLRVNDSYVILRTHRGHYIGQLNNRCPALMRRSQVDESGNLLLRSNTDIRVNPRIFYAGQDTIRGCVIDKLYELDEDVVDELKSIGATT